MATRWRSLSIGMVSVTGPRHPGVYVVYLGKKLVYVGSTWCLAERFPNYRFRCIEEVWCTPWGGSVHFAIKYKKSARFGDWLMDEARLIRRLKPIGNKRFMTGARTPSVR